MKTETWMPIKGFQTHLISDLGNVLNTNTGTILKTFLSRGYPAVKFKKHHFAIHRLLGMHFISNPFNYKCMNHKDGNKLNFALDNLEWCSYAYNIQHALNMGLIKRPSGELSYTGRKIINIETGATYPTIKDASKGENITLSTLRCYLSGHRSNKTALEYA